ncbi:MAG: diacylglycerol kinase family protein [Bryobacteraceae bacterium]|jgi:YegS/Rv2252/BmrU family lipid kinase
MKAAVIVNPHAGAGAARQRWPKVARLIEERLGPVAVHFTEGPGHATPLARQLADAGFDPVIAAGGDGTLNEAVNGVLSSGSSVRLGVLPLASGDFARTIGLAGLRHAIETLATGEARRVDVVRARFRGPDGDHRERHFINIGSFGLGAEAARRVRRWSRLLPRRGRYLAAALQALAAGCGFDARLWMDDAPPVEFHATTVAVANGRYQGGGILIAPQAAIDDGLADITLVERVGVSEAAANLRLLYSGGIWSHPKVHHWRAARVRAEGGTEVLVELDGELVGTLPLEAEVVAGRLRLICPAAPKTSAIGIQRSATPSAP